MQAVLRILAYVCLAVLAMAFSVQADLSTEFSGQVNLNKNATDLNAQIAGASIGVLCGFTALLVLISMTGVLG